MSVFAASICDKVPFMLKIQLMLPADGIFRVPCKGVDQLRVNQGMLPCKAAIIILFDVCAAG